MNCRGKLRGLGKVQMNVTFPHRQKGSTLSSLRFAQGQALSEAKDLSAERDRPFASLRVTRWDGCNGEGLFFTTEPCLKSIIGPRVHCTQKPERTDRQAWILNCQKSINLPMKAHLLSHETRLNHTMQRSSAPTTSLRGSGNGWPNRVTRVLLYPKSMVAAAGIS